jgi:hypothetical protein
MKKLLLPLIISLFHFSGSAQNFQWANQISGPGLDEGKGIAVDASGNIYTAGTFYYTVDFDPGAGTTYLTSVASSRDIYITKMDPSGNLLWAKAVGGGDTEGVTDIALDGSGNVYITGAYSSTSADFDPGTGTYTLGTANSSNDIYILKLDASGNFVWANAIGAPSTTEVAYGIAVDAAENVFTTGFFSGNTDFDPGTGTYYMYPSSTNSSFVLKLDVNGAFVWAKQLEGTAGNQSGYGIAVDASGDVYSTGTFESDIDLNPDNPGANVLTASGTADSYVSKFDASGVFQWGIQFTGTGYEYGQNIAVDGAGYIYAVGSTDGSTDFDPSAGISNQAAVNGSDVYIVKLSPAGGLSWARLLHGTGYESAACVATDSTEVYISGTFDGNIDLDPGAGTYTGNIVGTGTDMYISKLDSAGNFSWGRYWGANGYDYAWSICVGDFYKVYATGSFENTIDLDPNAGISSYPPYSAGNSDSYILKLDQCNNNVNAGIDQPICIGTNAVLAASGAVTYLWSTAETTPVINVSPSVTDTFVVTGTYYPGCAFNDSVVVTVNPLPATPNLGPDIDSCANSLGIGVPNDGVSSYIWTSNPPGFSSSNPQETVTVQGSNPVAYSLIIIDAVTFCSNSDTVIVTLKETPNVALSPNTIRCNFSPVTISTGPDANTDYSWTSNPPGFTANTYSISVTPGAATDYMVVATNTVSGCVVNDTTMVYSNGTPSLTLIAPFTNYACFGDSVHLADYLTASGGTPPYFIDWWNGPSHYYGVNPTYTVTASWTFSVSISDANSCSPAGTASFQLFNNGNNTDLTGHVTTPLPADVDNGWVYGFRHHPGSTGLDTVGPVALDANGRYTFIGLDNDDYLIKAIADPTAFPLAVPTYYGNEFQWDSSLVVTHGCTQIDTADIEVIELSTATGPGIVSGYILEGDSFGVGSRVNGHIGPIYPCVPGGPLKGIDVKLGKNPGGGIQARMMTDSTGKYEFTNLPLQGYKIYVDIPNLPMDSTRAIVLDATNNISVQNNYYADSNSVYVADTTIIPVSIHASQNTYENKFTVYPNPAKGNLFVLYELNKAGDITIELTNALGQAIKTDSFNQVAAGEFRYGIDIPSLHLKAGVYFISVLNDNRKYTQRLVVIE